MVHSSAADGYDQSAVASYVSARPSYHPDAVARLAELVADFDEPFDYPYRTELNVVRRKNPTAS